MQLQALTTSQHDEFWCYGFLTILNSIRVVVNCRYFVSCIFCLVSKCQRSHKLSAGHSINNLHLMRVSVVSMVRPRPWPGFNGKIPMRGITVRVREPRLAIGRPQNRKTSTKKLSFCFGESSVPDRQIWHRAKNDNSTLFNFNVAKSCN